MKKITAFLLSVLTALLCAAPFSSCKKEERNNEYLLGFVDGCYDINTEVDASLTSNFLAKAVEVYGGKSFRLWMHFNRVLYVTPENEPAINREAADKFHALISKLKAAGVERFICMTSNYLYPYEYGVTTKNAVPDPYSQRDEYEEFLTLFGKCFKILAEEFPEISYFEPTNEPDLLNGQNLCKNGYNWAGRDNGDNADYLFSDSDNAHIVADMCYYVTEAVKSVDKKNQVLLPGLCGYSSTADYLDLIYSAIASKTLPTGKSFADTRTDSYFTILNWHPYLLGGLGAEAIDENWLKLQKDIFAVAEKYGDGHKKVWFTEMGFTDLGSEETEIANAENIVKTFDYVKKELPFVETVFVFRFTNLTGAAKMSTFEDNFGLFRSLYDENADCAGEPKPIAVALYRYFKGENVDLSPLYGFCRK